MKFSEEIRNGPTNKLLDSDGYPNHVKDKIIFSNDLQKNACQINGEKFHNVVYHIFCRHVGEILSLGGLLQSVIVFLYSYRSIQLGPEVFGQKQSSSIYRL